MIILCDIDNCISDDSWRYPMIRHDLPNGRARYDAYHCAAGADSPANLDLVRVPWARVYFLTGMPEEYRHVRERWLWRHRIRYERILYRGTDHAIGSVELKRAMVRQLRAEGLPLEHCIAAYDDRPAVVAMYVEEGLPGFHLQIRDQAHLQAVL